jgi:hypothetical protein
MAGRLTEEEFRQALSLMRVGKQTQMIAHGVLVEGRPQTEFVKSTGLSKGAVSQAVNRVYEAALKARKSSGVPPGYKLLNNVLLPEAQAFQVELWAKQTAEKLKRGK